VSSEPVLRVEDLRVEFATDHGWATVVAGSTFDVGEREIVGLVGESGSGKTVTGLSVLRLLPRGVGRIAGGRVDLSGRDLLALSEKELRSVRGNEVAMVFQEPMTSLNPAFTIGDQIAETVRLHRGVSRRTARARAVEVLDLVGIPHARRRLDDYPHEFSGGMRQRAMIAMAVSCDPRLLIADEPTTALDVTIQAQVLELLVAMRAELGMSVLLVTHDLGVVAEVCERVVVMYAGQIVEQAEVGELFDHPRHPYTEGLLAAVPQIGTRGRRLPAIPGRTPEPWALPPGCRFAPRCTHATTVCTEPPSLVPSRPAHLSRCVRHDELSLRGAL
jgi:peptide/nickel transport system ATP-binding protein